METWQTNVFRLTFFQELTDSEFESEMLNFIDHMQVRVKSTYFTVSPVETGEEGTRHMHLHYIGEPIPDSTREKWVKKFREKGGKLYLGPKGINYQTKKVKTTDEMFACLRYPLKTGVSEFLLKLINKNWARLPEGFDVYEQNRLGALEYEDRKRHDEAKASREQRRGQHGKNLLTAALERYKQQPFLNETEVLEFLVDTSRNDETKTELDYNRIEKIANKVVLMAGIISVKDFVEQRRRF